MPYLGKSLAGSSSIRRFNVTSSTSATHTLTWAPPTEQSIIVSINGVKQHEDAYSISGTTLTLTNALVATDKMEVIGINDVGTTVTAAQGSVNTDKLADDAVTTAKIANDQVTTAKIADDQITTAKIADDQITSAKLANAINITSGNSLTIDSGATITNNGTNGGGFGKVLQVVSTTKTDTYSVSLAGAALDTVNSIEASITPTSTSSKIYMSGHIHGTGMSGVNSMGLAIFRDSTQICLADADGVRFRLALGGQSITSDNNSSNTYPFVYVDSPSSTSSLTYGIRIANTSNTTHNFYLNRTIADANISNRIRGTSTIVLMEIEG